jgi:hypothetical protein
VYSGMYYYRANVGIRPYRIDEKVSAAEHIVR